VGNNPATLGAAFDLLVQGSPACLVVRRAACDAPRATSSNRQPLRARSPRPTGQFGRRLPVLSGPPASAGRSASGRSRPASGRRPAGRRHLASQGHAGHVLLGVLLQVELTAFAHFTPLRRAAGPARSPAWFVAERTYWDAAEAPDPGGLWRKVPPVEPQPSLRLDADTPATARMAQAGRCQTGDQHGHRENPNRPTGGTFFRSGRSSTR